MSFNVQRPSGLAYSDDSRHPILRLGQNPSERGFFCKANRAVTLVEVMVALTLLTTVMLGVMSSFIQSRRITESSVLHAAATSLMYGIVEQIKQLDYTTQLPNSAVDPYAPTTTPPIQPPYFRVRINQNTVKWLQVVYTTAPTAPRAPTTKPSAFATPASLGATQNLIGSIPLSTVTGTTSQEINLDIWVWIDEIPDSANDAPEVKKVTLVYTYSYQDGSVTRTVRDWDVFLRTRFEK